MKATGIFLLLSLALFCYQGIAEADIVAGRGTKPACGNFNPNRGCTRIFEPICGTDNILYSNECMLCLQNMQRGTNVRIKNRGMCRDRSPLSAN